MKYFKIICSIVLFFSFKITQAQSLPKSEIDISNSLRNTITYLADDKLEGRLVGSRGERLAAEFIQKYFQSLGLEAAGENGFYQTFTLSRLSYKKSEIQIISKKNQIDKHSPEPDLQYPLAFSGCAKVEAKTAWLGYGIHAPEEGIDDYKNKEKINGKIFVIKIGFPEQSNPHSYIPEISNLEQKTDTAIAYGASAVIFINPNPNKKEPEFKPFFKNNLKKIPVYFLSNHLISDTQIWDNAKVKLTVDTITRSIEGHNVIGKIWNKSEQTVVIGAHYDHLGYNELGGSTYRSEKNELPQIHNGADDNASGTAALLELAEMIKSGKDFYSKNYVFIAFSGEEEGLLGSNYYCKNPTVDLSKVSYMINMDMLGRLDTSKAAFAISGTGTSKIWPGVIDSIPHEGLKLKLTESGTGSSDHTSFYYSKIPALHFFTGTHSDYHKPSDDAHLINYDGEAKVIQFIYRLIYRLRNESKLDYIRTKEDSSTSTKSSFKVTLGIMPDYLYEGKGIKIDGVTEGKPASNAGVKKGDLLIRMGDAEIIDMQSYIKVLSKHNKGDEIDLKIMRNNQEIILHARF